MRAQLQIFPNDSAPQKSAEHKAVLLKPALEALALQPNSVVFDATVGAAGHTSEIAKNLSSEAVLIGTDLDPVALERAKQKLDFFKGTLILENRPFSQIDEILKEHQISQLDSILADLGWSFEQTVRTEGLSFNKDEPLNMRYDNKSSQEALTAEDVVNTWSQDVLADIFYGLAGERFARRIAKEIVSARSVSPIKSTGELTEIIKRAIPAKYRGGKIHPATKVFQAIRMVVNDELGELERLLEKGIDLLKPEGRMAIITFHSVEDRIVKNTFRNWQNQAKGEIITKKPIIATTMELKQNPRSRSAKLRVFKKN